MILGIAAAVSAVAIVVQAFMMMGVIRTAKTVLGRLDELIPRVESALARAESALERGSHRMEEVSNKSLEVISIARTQLARVDDLMGDATTRLKVQMDRVELVVDDMLTRVQETVAVFHNGIMRPLRQISGVAAGIRGTIDYLFKGGRPNVAQATQDEEMFI